MNLNERAFAPNNRSRKKVLKIIHLQNGVASNQKRSSNAATSSKSSNVNKNHYEVTGSNSINISSNATITTIEENGVLVALTEGRGEASCEVGIIAINMQNPELSLFQISDTSSYIKVLNKIHFLNPVEILVPITITESRLVTFLKRSFPNVKITAIERSAFRKDNGLQFIKDICAKAYNAVILFLQYKYYVLTAAGALCTYLEMYKRKFYAKESIKVSYSESDFNTMIDVFVADRLELVSCALDSGTDSVHKKMSSLRGILNHCVTKLGTRMLRSTILQPPNQLKEIEERLDCVEELYKCPETLISIRDTLKKFTNFGGVLSLSTILKANAQYNDERHLNYILLLNSFFDEIEPMKELLSGRKCKFFHDIVVTLSRQEFQELKAAFKSIINENARPAHGEHARIERCFAIKPNYNDVLDFLRKKLADRKEEMHNHVNEIAKQTGYDLKLSHNQKKGFHMVFQLDPKQRKQFKKSTLPTDICLVDVMATMVTFTSIKLITLSNHLDDSTTEIMRISNLFLHDLLLHIRQHIYVFYEMCEQIAKLDILQSLATATASGCGYVRPKFDNFTNVIDGRHPLLDFILEKSPVPNNIISSPENRLHLITGPNGSGKSIYIRQIVLLQIMAQIGCFVPATSATFRICDRILARICFDDNMECGESTFTLEMKEVVYFFNVITDRTLIIMDELCRSTAEQEGTALAMAICEHLMKTPAFIYFTTHYTYITKLQQMYPHIRCWQLQTDEIHQEGRKPKLIYKHKVIPGVVTLEGYGLALTRSVWPDNVTKDCERMLTKLNPNSLESRLDKKMALKIIFENTLIELKRLGKCTKKNVFKLWMSYQEDLEKLGVTIRIDNWTGHAQRRNSTPSSSRTSCTQITDIDMVLTQIDHSTEILTNKSISIPQHFSPVPQITTVDMNEPSISDYSEQSYLMQKRLTCPVAFQGPILNSTSETSSLIDYNPHLKKISILQNLVVKPAVGRKGNTSLIRHYSDAARIDREILIDPDDGGFVPLQDTTKISDDNQIFKKNTFSPINIGNNGEMKIDELHPFGFISPHIKSPVFLANSNQLKQGESESFQLFSQHRNFLQTQLKISNDEDLSPPSGFIFTQNVIPKQTEAFPNVDNIEAFNFEHEEKEEEEPPNDWDNQEEFNFMYDKNSYVEEAAASQHNQTLFDFKTGPTTPEARNLFYNEEANFENFPNYEFKYDDDNIALIPEAETSLVYNSISSLNTDNFIKGLGYERTSTPVPVCLPESGIPNRPTGELNSLESRLKYAQDCLSNPPCLATNYNPMEITFMKKTSSDDNLINLQKNIISCSDATKSKASTSNTSFAKPTIPILKRKLMDSQTMNQILSLTPKDDEKSSYQIEDIEEPGIASGSNEVVIGSSSNNTFFDPNPEEIFPRKSTWKQTKSKPLNKLTKREVNEFYNRKMDELLKSNDPEDMERYYHEMSHRPSMRQMRESKVLCTARGTSDGKRVFDIPRKRQKIVRSATKFPSSGVQVDSTMFGDANSQVFAAYLEYGKYSNKNTLSFEEFKRQFNSNSS